MLKITLRRQPKLLLRLLNDAQRQATKDAGKIAILK